MKQRNLCLIGILLTILMIAGCYSGLNTYFGTAATLACQFDGESLCQESTVWTCEYIENMGYNTYMTTDPCLADLSVTLTGDASVNNAGDTLTLTATVSSTATANYDLEPGDVTVTVTDDLGNTIYTGTLGDYGVLDNLAPSNYETLTFDVVVDQDTTYTAEVATSAEYEFYNPDNTDTHSVTVGVTVTDTDGDGIEDGLDTCPLDADNDIDADGVCGDVDICPTVANPTQDATDADANGIPDECEITCNVGDLICFGDYTYEVTACDANGDPTYDNPTDCSVDVGGLGYCDSGACLASISTTEVDLEVLDISFVRYEGETGAIFSVLVKNNGDHEIGADLDLLLEVELISAKDANGNPMGGLPALVGATLNTMHMGTLQANDEFEYFVNFNDPLMIQLINLVDSQGALYDFTISATPDFNNVYGTYATLTESVTTFWPLDCFEDAGVGGDTTTKGHTIDSSISWLDYSADLAAGSPYTYVKMDECISGTDLKEYFCQDEDRDEVNTVTESKIVCDFGCANGVCTAAQPYDITLPDAQVTLPVELSSIVDESTAKFTVRVANTGTDDVWTPFDVKVSFYEPTSNQLLTECTNTFSYIAGGAGGFGFVCEVDITDIVPTIMEQGEKGIAVVLSYDDALAVSESDEDNIFKLGLALTDDDLLTYMDVADWLAAYP